MVTIPTITFSSSSPFCLIIITIISYNFQVHRAWMKADKVADSSILGEILAGYDEDDLTADIEFAEGDYNMMFFQ